MAWRFVTHLTEHEAIDYLCYELKAPTKEEETNTRASGTDGTNESSATSERTPLLDDEAQQDRTFADDDRRISSPDDATSFASMFAGLTALEIAAVSDAKKFLSQRDVQKIIVRSLLFV